MIDMAKSREAWQRLHDFGIANDSPNDQTEFMQHWLDLVVDMVGCQSCFLKVWRFLRLWPVDYGTGFRLWGICLHDYVNKELGRKLFFPELTLAPLTKKGIIQ